MFLVGLTGGIASGKSTVSDMLKTLGCTILDADKIAREVVEPGTTALKKIKDYFGSQVINNDGTLDRAKLGEIIFNDESKRKVLNSITHPEIYKTMMWMVFLNACKGKQFLILDLPLLFESKKMVPYMSNIIVVRCDGEQQLTRLMARNDFSEEEARARIDSQMSLVEKCSRATHVIDNSGTVQQTLSQVEQIHKSLRRSRAHWKFRIVVFTFVGLFIFTSVKLYNFLLP